MAMRHASFWENAIKTQGHDRATAFYTSLGLNHLEKKGVEWEGLTLSREPTEAEKLCVKSIAQVQESSKEQLITLLTQLRTDLISDGLEGIRKLKPSTYHELTLSASPESRERLRDRLIDVHRKGRLLVARELERQTGKAWLAEGSWQHPVDFDVVHKRNGFGPHDAKCIGYQCQCDITHDPACAIKNEMPTCSCDFKQDEEDEFDDLDELTDLTDARVANDVQSRITAAAARFALLGLVGAQLWAAVNQELADGSVSYIDRAAGDAAHKVIALGRYAEMRDRADSIERYEYSSLLDVNTCPSCASEDGKEAATPDDLEETPNPSCDGGGACRCFIIAISI